MKILVLSHTSELIGGAERSLLDVFDYLTSQYKVQPNFILREPLGGLVPELKKRRWPYHALRYSFWSWPKSPTAKAEVYQYAVDNRRSVEAIRELIKKLQPDVVMTNSIVSPWAALAAHFEKVPHIWIVREYGDIDHNRQFEIPRRQTFADVGNLSNLVVANSATLAKHIEQYVPANKVAILYNPFDLTKLRQRASQKVSSPYKHKSSLKLIMTGNPTATKGQLEAINAVGQLNHDRKLTELAIAGKNLDKAFHEQMLAAIEHWGIADKVHLIGLQANTPALIKLADLGVVASRQEAFGRTTFEFLALGKPVIGANSGATPEMVKPGKTGYLFEVGDSQDLAKALAHYHHQPELLKRHGQAGAALAAELMAGPDNIDALYQKMAVAIKQSVPTKPIYFWQHWLGAKLDLNNLQPPRASLRLRAKQKAKGAYFRARRLKTKLIGRNG